MSEHKGNQLSKEEKDLRFETELMPVIDPLYNFAYRLTLDEDDANDLVQETYLKAYRFFDYFEQGTNAKAWLFRILKNSFINDFRKKSKQPAKVDYSEIEGYYNSEDVDSDSEGGGTSDMRSQSVQDLIGDEVASALNSLPVDFRTVIILCDLEGFTYEEMAKILDIPIGTVRSRLHRARNFLKEKLEKYAKTMGYDKTSDEIGDDNDKISDNEEEEGH
jgi:RNA polymerase sigma factor (sigma-70 family)